jgi:3-(3-hydroxy-phenyl)propionate hydroxylase
MVVNGQATEALLDTYAAERGPHVREITASAIGYGRMTCTLDPIEAAERDRRLRSDPRPLTERLPFSLPPLRSGPLIRAGGGELFIQPAPSGSGVRLDDLVGPRFLVLGRTREEIADCSDWWSDELGALVTTLDQLPRVAPELEQWLNRRSADVVVVRPDRYVMAANGDLGQVTREVAPYFEARKLEKV